MLRAQIKYHIVRCVAEKRLLKLRVNLRIRCSGHSQIVTCYGLQTENGTVNYKMRKFFYHLIGITNKELVFTVYANSLPIHI